MTTRRGPKLKVSRKRMTLERSIKRDSGTFGTNQALRIIVIVSSAVTQSMGKMKNAQQQERSVTTAKSWVTSQKYASTSW